MFNLFKKKPDQELINFTNSCLERLKIIESISPFPSKTGKYEALICCTFLTLQLNPGSLSDKNKNHIFRHLVNIREEYGIKVQSGTMVDLVNERIQFYISEVDKVFNNRMYINGKIYNIIYEDPLTKNPARSNNLTEIMKFSLAFSQLVKSI